MDEWPCINEVIGFLEVSLAGRRKNLASPENDPTCPAEARIDQVFEIDDRRFALEHTLIEPLEGFFRVNRATQKLDQILSSRCQGIFKTSFDLCLSTTWIDGLSQNRGLPKFTEALMEMLIENSKAIDDLEDGSPPLIIGTIADIEIEVNNNLMTGVDDYPLGPRVTLWSPSDSGDRSKRLQRSMKSKIKKLEKWNVTHSTVLVLEDRDLFLTNAHTVLSEVESYIGTDAIPVDFLFLVDASHSTGRIFPFIEDGVWGARSPDGRLRNTKIDASGFER